MANVVSLIALFVLVSAILYTTIIVLGLVHDTNVGNCAYNVNHTLENCSLSNADFDQQQASAEQSSYMFKVLGYMSWFIVIAAVFAAFAMFTKKK